MYSYNEVDQQLVEERVAQFRDQTGRFLDGELSEEAFRPLRLMNGLYIQTHAPMLRIAIPYGLLSTTQLHKLADITDEYDRGYGHFTTRQNLQLNWPELARVPDILAELAQVQMHAIQTSGNCIRNVTADHLAGISPDEIEDPRPYCELIRQWSSLHPEFSYLPRKFKIAVTGCNADRAATQVHDIGIELLRGPDGETGYKILVGGGLGRTPMIGKVIREYLPRPELLRYLEAIMRIYNLQGRRDNKYKARIKILVNSLGIEEFTRQVEAEYESIIGEQPPLDEARLAELVRHFLPPAYRHLKDLKLSEQFAANHYFKAWYHQNTLAHKVPGYRAAFISLKVAGVAPGDMTSAQMHLVAELAERYSFSMVRTTHSQNLVLADVQQSHLFELWRALAAADLARPNIDRASDIICCPGLDFCSLANANTIAVAAEIDKVAEALDFQHDLGELKIKISGCMNACGHHHVGHIGILGVDKKGSEWYQVTLGGSAEEDASLGKIIGPSFSREEIAATLGKILSCFVEVRQEGESFLQTVRRLGVGPFKEWAYADDVPEVAPDEKIAHAGAR